MVLERWTDDRTNLQLHVISGAGVPPGISAAQSKSAPSLTRPSRTSRRTSQAPKSSDVDMQDTLSCPTPEASRGTRARTSRRIYRSASGQLSRDSSALGDSKGDGLRPSDMQAWAMGAPAPRTAERSISGLTGSLKRSASTAGLPDQSACLPGTTSQGLLRRPRKLISLSTDGDCLEDKELPMVEHAGAVLPQTPNRALAIGGCSSQDAHGSVNEIWSMLKISAVPAHSITISSGRVCCR